MNLTRFDHNGLELLIDSATGEVFASQRGLARLVDVSDTTIMRWATAAQITLKTAETPTSGGLQGAALYDEKAIMQAIAKYKPELIIQFAEAGLRIYLHRLAGYEVISTAVNPQPAPTPIANPHQDLIDRMEAYNIIMSNASKCNKREIKKMIKPIPSPDFVPIPPPSPKEEEDDGPPLPPARQPMFSPEQLQETVNTSCIELLCNEQLQETVNTSCIELLYNEMISYINGEPLKKASAKTLLRAFCHRKIGGEKIDSDFMAMAFRDFERRGWGYVERNGRFAVFYLC